MKSASGKFTPIHQFLYHDAVEALPRTFPLSQALVGPEAVAAAGRYGGQVAVFGAEAQAALGALLAVEWPERLGFWPQGAWQVELQLEGEGRLALITRPQLGPPGGPPGQGVAAGPQ